MFFNMIKTYLILRYSFDILYELSSQLCYKKSVKSNFDRSWFYLYSYMDYKEPLWRNISTHTYIILFQYHTGFC